jgi:2'-deoxynucleoside 5'-phosphate N-hydrolase
MRYLQRSCNQYKKYKGNGVLWRQNHNEIPYTVALSKIMRAYISVSFSRRNFIDKEINAIVDALKELNISSFVFVDNYKFDLAQEKQMMKQAMADIDACDILIAETSDKGIGIGIEAGYAKAKGKKVIYLRQKDTEHSTTVSGISDYKIIYTNIPDLQQQLSDTVNEIVKSRY